MAELTIYSDYVCPFCYLGQVSLETLEERRDEQLSIDWKPFDLRQGQRGPDGRLDDSDHSGKDESYYEQARENVRRLQEEYGAEDMLDPGEVPLSIDSRSAQLVSAYVQKHHSEDWRAFDRALFAALWEDGHDIGDIGRLETIAESVDLSPEVVEGALADESHREQVEMAFERARRAGISGVPTFIHGEHVARGAVPPEQLERLLAASTSVTE